MRQDGEEAQVAAWLGARAERTLTTACARVFLAGTRAFKLKRRVDLGYLDFTTLERRRWALERELAFNAATAPDLYLGVHAVTRQPSGELALEGAGEPVDYVLEMRRFDEAALLSADPSRVDGALAETLGRTVARHHAAAPERPDAGRRALRYALDSNAELLRRLAPRLGPEAVEALIAAADAEYAAREDLLARRDAAGFARRCHGDLHLGNIFLQDGAPVLFDCIEFSDLLSDIDILYDLAFLLMDLDFRGRREAAARVLSAWFDEAARSFSDGLVEGLAALPLMLSVRAAVRCHVSANGGDEDAARAYLAASAAHLAPPPPRLAAVGGLSGTGKTTVARMIAPHLGAAPGALVLRTDEVRKRLAGVGPAERLEAATYTEAFYRQVYETLFAEAGRVLAAGRAVVLDATFVAPDLRARAERLAAEAGVPFEGAWLDAPREVLAARIGGRAGDASDASLATLDMQLARDLGPMTWRRLDASGPPGSAAAAFLAGG